MITAENAKKIGITYCADAMGREFVTKYAGNSTTAFSEENNRMFCFLGVCDSELNIDMDKNIILTSREEDAFPYRASCLVSLDDGSIDDFKYFHP